MGDLIANSNPLTYVFTRETIKSFNNKWDIPSSPGRGIEAERAACHWTLSQRGIASVLDTPFSVASSVVFTLVVQSGEGDGFIAAPNNGGNRSRPLATNE